MCSMELHIPQPFSLLSVMVFVPSARTDCPSNTERDAWIKMALSMHEISS